MGSVLIAIYMLQMFDPEWGRFLSRFIMLQMCDPEWGRFLGRFIRYKCATSLGSVLIAIYYATNVRPRVGARNYVPKGSSNDPVKGRTFVARITAIIYDPSEVAPTTRIDTLRLRCNHTQPPLSPASPPVSPETALRRSAR